VGEVTLQTVWPRPGAGAGDAGESAPNNASVVLLAEVAGVRILLTGDVEPSAQAALARDLGGLRVDVLKVPHHGSRHQDLDWLTSLGARLALVSVGEDNDYGHPAPDLVTALSAGGAQVWRTDLAGDVVVVAADGEVGVAAGG
jgi:competence protein ComEC